MHIGNIIDIVIREAAPAEPFAEVETTVAECPPVVEADETVMVSP